MGCCVAKSCERNRLLGLQKPPIKLLNFFFLSVMSTPSFFAPHLFSDSTVGNACEYC